MTAVDGRFNAREVRYSLYAPWIAVGLLNIVVSILRFCYFRVGFIRIPLLNNRL